MSTKRRKRHGHRRNIRWLSSATRRSHKPDYTKFLSAYVRSQEWWAPQDFGKPNIEKLNAESRTWLPSLKGLWSEETKDHHRLLAKLAVEDAEAEQKGLVAWPKAMYLEVICPKTDAVVEIRFSVFDKAPNRMPEALWLSFSPMTQQAAAWSMNKVSETMRAADVVRGGGRRMHAVTDTFTCVDGHESLAIKTMDAPVIAFLPKSPLNFSEDLPDESKGGAREPL